MVSSARLSLWPSFAGLLALLAWGIAPGERSPALALRLRETLRNDLPSRADTERMERGYYEQIIDAGRRLGGVGIGPGRPITGVPAGAMGENDRLTLPTDDVREFVLRPNLIRDPSREVPWSTNALGMRDGPYETGRRPGTFRIAMTGDSIGMGWGVNDHEGFEPRLERLWDARSRAAGGPAVEILNFAVPGHGPGQRWSHFDKVGWAFAPDVVIYEATPADVGWDERRLRGTLARGVGFDAPVYRDVLAAAGVRPGLTSESYRRLLRPLRWALLEGVYRTAAADCQAHGVPTVWVLIPRVGKPIDPAERRGMIDRARAAGFDVVIDVTDAYEGAEPAALAVGPDDFHPNADGHARIALALDRAFSRLPKFSRLWAGAPGKDSAAKPIPAQDHDALPDGQSVDRSRGAVPQ
ncbi:MAG: SGNH/GDSL hydrolase family protein [Isosphaeraceae bacterium]